MPDTTSTPEPNSEINAATIVSYCFNAIVLLFLIAFCAFSFQKLLKKKFDQAQVPLLTQNQRVNIPSVRFTISEEDEDIEDLQSPPNEKVKKLTFNTFLI